MFALVALALASRPDAVELYRQFTPGQKLSYEVRAHLMTEQKQIGLAVFLPDEVNIDYDFSLLVKKAGSDGFAEVEYRRPEIRITHGQTEDDLPRLEKVKVDWVLSMMLSPVNEITDVKDLSPKKAKGTGGLLATARAGRAQEGIVGQMVQELHSLALFVGNLDSSLDLSPKLPLEEAKPGDTWKRTVGYQPAQVKGTDQHAMQRLDYTFTYAGKAQGAGGQVHRVVGVVSLDTDASKFLNQAMGMTASESGLKRLMLKIDAKIEYDLDLKTFDTLEARGSSQGGFTVEVAGAPEPVVEERFKGTTTMRLVKRS